jgi:hypothetical protein
MDIINKSINTTFIKSNSKRTYITFKVINILYIYSIYATLGLILMLGYKSFTN